MESTRTTLVCVLWGCLVLFNFSNGCDYQIKERTKEVLQDGISEPRGRHRLQLLFPLLLRISTRLATLVPTALMGLAGIILFVVFSKKAFIISLLALFLSLSRKHSAQRDDIYIHKINSYSDYNDEEHIHYHHHGPPKHKQYDAESYYPIKEWNKKYKRKITSFPNITNAVSVHDVIPFKPLFSIQRRTTVGKQDTAPVFKPVFNPSLFEEVDKNLVFLREEHYRK